MAETISDIRPLITIRSSESGAVSAIVKAFGVSNVCARILSSRDINDVKTAGDFLYPRLSSMNSPFEFINMTAAADRMRKAMENREKIALFSDSDIDGLSSLSIMRSVFDAAGILTISRFPVDDENYGLTQSIIDEMKTADVSLLITLDCGIRDIDEIKYAFSLGIDTIVCDHHEQGDCLPEAIIVDQKVREERYPFRDLAGAGVALKLCHGFLYSFLPGYSRNYLLVWRDEKNLELGAYVLHNGAVVETFQEQSISGYLPAASTAYSVFYGNLQPEDVKALAEVNPSITPVEELLAANNEQVFKTLNASLLKALRLPDSVNAGTGSLFREFFFDISFNRPKKIRAFLETWIPFAALGTIADVVPLTGENRIIVAKGMEYFQVSSHPVFESIRNEFGDVDVKDVAWKVAPLLNTPGRFGKTVLAADFFMGKNLEDCSEKISEIKKLNDERRKSVKECMAQFSAELDSGKHNSTSNFVIIISDKVAEGFTGLIANRIADHTGKPAIIISDNPDKDILKGSGRAPDGYDFLPYVEPFSADFERFGGHSRAFGFSISRSKIAEMMTNIDKEMASNEKRVPSITVDILAENPVLLNSFFQKEYRLIAPFGEGNNEPLFITENVMCDSFFAFGNDSRHGKFIFSGVQAIAWSRAEEMREVYELDNPVSLVYKIEEDKYTRRMRMLIEQFWVG